MKVIPPYIELIMSQQQQSLPEIFQNGLQVRAGISFQNH